MCCKAYIIYNIIIFYIIIPTILNTKFLNYAACKKNYNLCAIQSNFTKFVSVKKKRLNDIKWPDNDPKTRFAPITYLPTIITTTSDYSVALGFSVYTVTKRQFHYSVTLPIEQERPRLQRTKKYPSNQTLSQLINKSFYRLIFRRDNITIIWGTEITYVIL